MSACVGELGKTLEVAPSTVSHHIKELHQAGLIRMKRHGQKVACWIDPETLNILAGFFQEAHVPGQASSPKGMEQ